MTNRTVKIELRVTREEKRAIENRAEAINQSVSEFIRRELLDLPPTDRPAPAGSVVEADAAAAQRFDRRVESGPPAGKSDAAPGDPSFDERVDEIIAKQPAGMPGPTKRRLARKQVIREGRRP